MIIEIDFQSEDPIYLQLRNQIVLGIASCLLHEGDALPPVRTLASEIGINMHTVNKAYSLLREEGFVTIDRRRGAVINVDADQAKAKEDIMEILRPVLAEAVCRGLGPRQIHQLVDEVLAEWRTEPDEQ